MTKKHPDQSLESLIRKNKLKVPRKRVFMFQNSLYCNASFIPRSEGPLPNEIDVSVNLHPHIQTLPKNQVLLHEGLDIALSHQQVSSKFFLPPVALCPSQAHPAALPRYENEESLCLAQLNGLSHCLDTVCAENRRTLHDSASPKPNTALQNNVSAHTATCIGHTQKVGTHAFSILAAAYVHKGELKIEKPSSVARPTSILKGYHLPNKRCTDPKRNRPSLIVTLAQH